ncbi:Late embryogenesis abundant protein [Carex littledalei]|uniref:Late embryogenesis abundant protein n=1 Tax=Carex littledalei TaxID=544730 RepID=A0A833VDY5_9POAL|nr:Late embryogenesis abundant protein [Carex littledalei]
MAAPGHSYQATQKTGGARRLLYCLIALVITIVVIVGLVILIFWLVVRPKPIDYYVDGASVRDFNISSSDALNATFDLTLIADNRNHKVSVYYDYFEVTVWYKDQMIAFSNVDPFHQPKRNATRLDVHPLSKSTPLLDSVTKDLKHDRSGGKVELEVRVRSRIRFKVGLTKTKHYTLRAYCPVVVKFSKSTDFDRVYCDVDI